MTKDRDELDRLADRIAQKMGGQYGVVRCVFGHGYPKCGCTWRLVEIGPGHGGYTTLMYLGETKPKAILSLKGILFGLTNAPIPVRNSH